MLNDILTGKQSLEGEPREQDPFRKPGEGAPPPRPPAPQPVQYQQQPYPMQQPDPIAEQMLAGYEREAARSKGRNEIIIGIVLIVVGIGITSVTYDHASQQGGTYVVAYGPIIVGVINLFRGLMRSGS